MADRHEDGVDSWLTERIEPLAPPPGTFELIKRRARRRKFRRLAITATSAAVIIAAAVTVPQVVNLNVLSPSSPSGVAAGPAGNATAAGGGHAESSASASASARKPAPAGGLPAPASVPGNFRPTSVTFVGTDTGWVIGQALTPGHCATQYCTSVARTDDAGKTWAGVPAPFTGAADGATGVSQIRFLNLDDGWAFGPELYVTHDGGRTWTQVKTSGQRVTDLETVGTRVFALFASCTGSGEAFSGSYFDGDCTTYTLYSSPAASSDWTPVGPSTSGLTDGTPNEVASLVLTGGRGFLLAPGGALYAGPVDGSGAWKLVNSINSACPVEPDGNAAPQTSALFGAVNANELIMACTLPQSSETPGSPRETKKIYSSPNGGGSWIQIATAPVAATATSIAASPSETVVLGTDQGIDLLPRGDVAWRQAQLGAAAPAGGFSYVGMTTDEQGIALPANPAAGTVWFTFNGGQSWQPSDINGS
jgi:photosystem II stability/assembly factor-like uncharacterized protein